jgi:hypothetical protein
MRIVKRLMLCSSLGFSMACHAGAAIAQAAPPHGPQIMIYFRQPLWSAGSHRIYGLRFEQTSMPSAAPNAVGFNPLRRREILSFEIGRHQDLRVEFARRLIWDVNRQEFGLGSLHPSLAFSLPPRPAILADTVRPRP